ncbi:MAG TPA: hypothetical protein VG125_17785 [Pirellulales bacterium]|jgi:DNA-directed RNA polymerase subunit RPC12/RpoP|nr:hypothetical protein [Pirellulales bacterium]
MLTRFACPRCEQPANVQLIDSTLTCPHCGLQIHEPPDAREEGRLRRCLICPSTDLFVRKDFPQRLGVAIVVVGFALSCITWFNYWVMATFAVLFATALADFVLYLIVGDSLACYRCGAEYRRLGEPKGYPTFDLETHERYRQQAARLEAGADKKGAGLMPHEPSVRP